MSTVQLVRERPAKVAFPEPIRLVIWDLDETFWDGTLTEGGVSYRHDNHDRVVELAKRGIISAICSKNEHSKIEAILRERGLWDYFVFPSINWEAKGGRIADIVAAIQLRAPTVLFIDDNPGNLEEARFFTPGLQVATPDILEVLLELPELRGKNDIGLSRLKQYKLLEERQYAMTRSGGDNVEFLRKSDIRLHIEFDIEKHIDRAIELINRTNQLNFTKKRLPEDLEAARTELCQLLRRNTMHAGLVSVSDRFGDYGYIGLFLHDRVLGLVHFCFSCRILNMHVERWLYQYLGRPRFKVEGEVLTDLFADGPQIDWITVATGDEAGSQDDDRAASRYLRVFARGGCDIASLTHYFAPSASTLLQEANFVRDGLSIRIDHSLMLRAAIEEVSGRRLEALRRLGFTDIDFKTDLKASGDGIAILSFWADASVPVYRHKRLGFDIPFWMIGTQTRNLIADRSLDATIAKGPAAQSALDALREEYVHVGLLSEEQMYENYVYILNQLPDPGQAVLLLANELGPTNADGLRHRNPRHAAYNRTMRRAALNIPAARLIDVAAHLSPEGIDLRDYNHFDRIVYHRIYMEILSTTQDRTVAKAAESP